MNFVDWFFDKYDKRYLLKHFVMKNVYVHRLFYIIFCMATAKQIPCVYNP